MHMSAPNRREFLSTLGVGLGWPAHAFGSPAPREDYLFRPGLRYFNTGSMGPCSRQVIEATMRAWYELETEPTGMGYGEDGTTLAAAEAVRLKGAQFLGC